MCVEVQEMVRWNAIDVNALQIHPTIESIEIAKYITNIPTV